MQSFRSLKYSSASTGCPGLPPLSPLGFCRRRHHHTPTQRVTQSSHFKAGETAFWTPVLLRAQNTVKLSSHHHRVPERRPQHFPTRPPHRRRNRCFRRCPSQRLNAKSIPPSRTRAFHHTSVSTAPSFPYTSSFPIVPPSAAIAGRYPPALVRALIRHHSPNKPHSQCHSRRALRLLVTTTEWGSLSCTPQDVIAASLHKRVNRFFVRLERSNWARA